METERPTQEKFHSINDSLLGMERAETLRREEEVPCEQSRRRLAGFIQVQQGSSDIILSYYIFECLKAAGRGKIASILKRNSIKS